jgi:Inositol monophosphatase family
MWALDPIDGTKGFLRGEQYAVCLALIVNSIVQVGVIGCPNLHVDVSKPDGERGAMFVAVRGQGAQQLPLSSPYGDGIPLRISSHSPLSSIRFLESVEAAHSAHGFNARVAAVLGTSQSPNRMDSQAKYCVLSRGVEGDVYLRMPVPGMGYQEKIWVFICRDTAVMLLLIPLLGSQLGSCFWDSSYPRSRRHCLRLARKALGFWEGQNPWRELWRGRHQHRYSPQDHPCHQAGSRRREDWKIVIAVLHPFVVLYCVSKPLVIRS